LNSHGEGRELSRSERQAQRHVAARRDLVAEVEQIHEEELEQPRLAMARSPGERTGP